MESRGMADGRVFGDPITTASLAADPGRSVVPLGVLADELMPAGLAAGELLLISGPPGIGKSRFAMGVLRDFCQASGRGAVYVTTPAELSEPQVRRLAAATGAVGVGVSVATVSSVDDLCGELDKRPPGLPFPVVIDSLLGLVQPWEQEKGLRRIRAVAERAGIALIVLAGNHLAGVAAGPRSPHHPADASITIRLDVEKPDIRLLTLVKYRNGAAPVYVRARHTAEGLGAVSDSDADTVDCGHGLAVIESVVAPVAVMEE